MRTIGVYFAPHNNRSQIVGRAMAYGIAKKGVKVVLRQSINHRRRCDFEVAIFYGLAGGLAKVLEDYRDSGRKAFYIDLGYWARRKRTRWDGFHKIALNGRHPTDYFQQKPKGPERFLHHGLTIAPWRKAGRHIVVVGMSAKAATAEGLRPHQWETETINRLREITDRPIIYRPKPNWLEAKPIPGTVYGKGPALEQHLLDCHAVVAHHSNAAVDALLAGVPCICPGGVASVLSGHELEQIEDPPMPDGREQFAYDLAWTQWSVEEMQNGLCYQYLVAEGLL